MSDYDRDSIERDFAPVTDTELALAQLIRGVDAPSVAIELALSPADFEALVAAALVDTGSPDEATWIANATLDEITRQAFVALGRHDETRAPLLAVLVDVVRLRREIQAT